MTWEERLETIEGIFQIYKCLCIADTKWLIDELKRFKRGDLTEEEFQNQCHNYDGNDLKRFDDGCKHYQTQKFGRSMKDVEVEFLKSWILKYEEKFGPLNANAIYKMAQQAFVNGKEVGR